jgi:hypothetical protein
MAIIYNLYKNRYLEVSDNKISFVNKFRTKTVAFNQIDYIKLFKEREGSSNRAFRLIRIRIKNRMRPIIIRPNDYENENDLIKEFQDIKSKLESGNV